MKNTRFVVDAAGFVHDREAVASHLTDYGFRYGAALFERLGDIRGTAITRVVPDVGQPLEIYVSPAGRSVRVFRGGRELK